MHHGDGFLQSQAGGCVGICVGGTTLPSTAMFCTHCDVRLQALTADHTRTIIWPQMLGYPDCDAMVTDTGGHNDDATGNPVLYGLVLAPQATRMSAGHCSVGGEGSTTSIR